MLAGAHSVVQVPMRGPVDGPVCSLLHRLVRGSVRHPVALHSVVQWAVHGIMAQTVYTSVHSLMRQRVHAIVHAFVHGKVHRT